MMKQVQQDIGINDAVLSVPTYAPSSALGPELLPSNGSGGGGAIRDDIPLTPTISGNPNQPKKVPPQIDQPIIAPPDKDKYTTLPEKPKPQSPVKPDPVPQPSNIVKMKSKTIRIYESDGTPADMTEVSPAHGDYVITGPDGLAMVYAESDDEIIRIDSIYGDTITFKFSDLPGEIYLHDNSLPAVTVTANPKKEDAKEFPWKWVVAGVGVLALALLAANGDQPQKVTL